MGAFITYERAAVGERAQRELQHFLDVGGDVQPPAGHERARQGGGERGCEQPATMMPALPPRVGEVDVIGGDAFGGDQGCDDARGIRVDDEGVPNALGFDGALEP